jgi:sec-independent protein translocase protein TatA
LIVGAVAVILFGKKLPDVARSLGGTYRDFRRSLQEIQSQFDLGDTLHRAPPRNGSSSYASNYTAEEPDEFEQPTAPQFQLPSSAASASEPTKDSVN